MLFMEPEDLLSCLQGPSNGSYPEPDQSSPYRTYLSEIHFNIILPHISASFWSSISFWLSHQSPTRMCLILMHATYLITLIILGDKSIIYEAPHYTAFSNLQIHDRFSVQIFSSAPCSQTHRSIFLL
jgi:hypothetical protein